jgi:hypothetical protein
MMFCRSVSSARAIAIAHVSFGNYIAVTYKKKEKPVPTMWRVHE